MIKRQQSKERGANLAEMSLVLPVALVVIYALIYFTFTMVIEGIAEASIHAALDEATILPGLEKIPEVIPDDCDEYVTECTLPENSDDETVQFCCAVTEVISKARSKAQNSFMGTSYEDSTFAYFSTSEGNSKQIRVTFPVESEDGTPAHLNPISAYQDEPIVMEMDFAIRPIFPGLPPIQRTVRAVAFYEVQSSLSYPIPVDCMGNAYGSSDYDLSSCTCLKAGKGKNATNQCVVCDNGASAFIPRHPEKGVKPDGSTGEVRNGCWCPTHEYCESLYGPGAKQNNSGSNCECVCVNWYGAYGQYEGSGDTATLKKCACQHAPSGITGVGGESVTFQTERVRSGDTCYCKKEDGSALSDADCDRLFPSAAGNIVANKDGCSCRCKYGGASWNSGSAGNNCNGNVWGTDWAPQYNYEQLRAGATCDCECTSWTGGLHVVQEMEFNSSSGKCECTEIKGQPGETCESSGSGTSTTYVKYDGNCNCRCDTDKVAEACGADATLDADCRCTCNNSANFSGKGSCAISDGGAGGLG